MREVKSDSTKDIKIENFPIFRRISNNSLVFVQGIGIETFRYKSGDIVFDVGDIASHIYFLQSINENEYSINPFVVIYSPLSENKPKVLYRVIENDLFGEVEFLEKGLKSRNIKRSTYARAMSDCEVFAIKIEDIAFLVDNDPVFRDRFMKLSYGRILDGLTGEHNRLRSEPDIVLADWLVEAAADFGEANGNQVRIQQRMSQTDIADALGIARETISRRLKEWERTGLIMLRGPSQGLELLDYDRIVRIASLRDSRDGSMIRQILAAVDAEIGNGNVFRARNIVLDVLRFFPSSPHLLHRLALAMARSGDFEQALQVLQKAGLVSDISGFADLRALITAAARNPFASLAQLRSHPWQDEGFDEDDADAQGLASPAAISSLMVDIVALEARILKDMYFEMSGGDAKQAAAQRAQAAYARLFEYTGNHYPGINAASMALICGDEQEAGRLARKVLDATKKATPDYWNLASRAEALLLIGSYDEARSVLHQAALCPDGSDGAKSATASQMDRLAPFLPQDVRPVVDVLDIGEVCVIAGHIFRGSLFNASEQANLAEMISAQAESYFSDNNIRYVYGSLAAGSDIILAETAINYGAEYHAVLPFSGDEFIETSIKIGETEDIPHFWRDKYKYIIQNSKSVSFLNDTIVHKGNLDEYFYRCFCHAAGLAMIRSHILSSEVSLLSALDPKSSNNIAGTNSTYFEWESHGRKAHKIIVSSKNHKNGNQKSISSIFRPVLFLFGHELNDVIQILNSIIEIGLDNFYKRKIRSGIECATLLLSDINKSIMIAKEISKIYNDKTIHLALDFGPVLGRGGKIMPNQVTQLSASSGLSGFPYGYVLATEQFVAQFVMKTGRCDAFRLIGRSDTQKGREATYRASPPIYRLNMI